MQLPINKYWPIHGYIRQIVIIHQNPVILTKQAIVLVNVEIGGYNGTDRAFDRKNPTSQIEGSKR